MFDCPNLSLTYPKKIPPISLPTLIKITTFDIESTSKIASTARVIPPSDPTEYETPPIVGNEHPIPNITPCVAIEYSIDFVKLAKTNPIPATAPPITYTFLYPKIFKAGCIKRVKINVDANPSVPTKPNFISLVSGNFFL
ncbi:hypothetical protein AYI70_g12132 [Smittium culicis]|uniref:Uncharacterized protein n=1 Tax=Smittium culicis TaxID=133412 RepID=A0A1R1WYP7_9FUNG|nr:hypothetical protein AYI70_g12132 [Smittium culicis]